MTPVKVHILTDTDAETETDALLRQLGLPTYSIGRRPEGLFERWLRLAIRHELAAWPSPLPDEAIQCLDDKRDYVIWTDGLTLALGYGQITTWKNDATILCWWGSQPDVTQAQAALNNAATSKLNAMRSRIDMLLNLDGNFYALPDMSDNYAG